MGFVDRLRMNNLYPSTGIGPPDFNGGFDISKYLQMNMQPQTIPTEWPNSYIKRPPTQIPPNTTYMPSDTNVDTGMTGGNLGAIGQGLRQGPVRYLGNNPGDDAYNQQKLQLERDKLEQTDNLTRMKLASAEKLGEKRIGIQQQRADIYDFKAKHPNMQIKAVKGGNYMAFDAQTGEAIDTGVDSGLMSEEDLHKLIGTQRLDQIGAQGKIQKDLLTTRGNQSINAIGARIKGQKDILASKSQTSLLPTQQKVAAQNRATELMNTNPELSQFITVNPDGTVSVEPPSSGFFGNSGPTTDQYAKIQGILYPKSGITPNSYSNPTSPKTTTPIVNTSPLTEPPKAPTGWKYIPKPGGGWTAVEDKGGS